jgi:hypothetical protein
LFDDNAEVIGIVSRKDTGFSSNFKEFKQLLISEKNILLSNSNEMLNFAENIKNQAGNGSVQILGIDYGQINIRMIKDLARNEKSIAVNFERMIKLSDNLERSANVGIGYAFAISDLLDKNKNYFEYKA